MTPIPDKSLFRCTIRKSLDVTKKLILYVAIVIDALAGILLAGYGILGLWNVLSGRITEFVTNVAAFLVAFLFSIPWYWYVGVVAVAAIPVYSFIWCVTRELTEEDWVSKDARCYECVLMLASIVGMILCGLIITVIAMLGALPLYIGGFAGIAFAFIGLIGVISDAKALRFPGAYLNYRKRVKP